MEKPGLRSVSESEDRRNTEARARSWFELACSSNDPLQRAEAWSHLADEAASAAARIIYDFRFPNVGPKEAAYHGDDFGETP
jgi:hypothetical protein